MNKANIETLLKMNYDEGKAYLENMGYAGGNTGETESNISDYVQDEYFTLYGPGEEEADVIAYSVYCNDAGENNPPEIVKEGWSRVYND